MKVRCFYPNRDGKILFTKEELEKLLNEVYEEGRSTGWTQGYNAAHPVSITYPYTPYWYTSSSLELDVPPSITYSGSTTTLNTTQGTEIKIGDNK